MRPLVCLVFSILTACGADATSSAPCTGGLAACDAGSADASWCTTSLAPGEPARTSPDACTSDRSSPPPLSSDAVSDFCVACTPRCGATKYAFSGEAYYTDTDLPTGACSREGESCDMAGTAPLSECDGVVSGCALNTYRCSCTGGQWQCLMTSQGGGACLCEKPASEDAGSH